MANELTTTLASRALTVVNEKINDSVMKLLTKRQAEIYHAEKVLDRMKKEYEALLELSPEDIYFRHGLSSREGETWR
jgi:hypothetical protein